MLLVGICGLIARTQRAALSDGDVRIKFTLDFGLKLHLQQDLQADGSTSCLRYFECLLQR